MVDFRRLSHIYIERVVRAYNICTCILMYILLMVTMCVCMYVERTVYGGTDTGAVDYQSMLYSPWWRLSFQVSAKGVLCVHVSV